MAIATIPEVIERGYLSLSLIGNANAKGAMFGGQIAAPGSIVSIHMVTQALDWGYSGGAQTDADLREVANYLVWLMGIYGQQAQAIIDGTSGGGSVIPPPSGTLYPFVITSADFESDGVSYNNPDIVGDNLMIFINEWTQQWLFAPDSFIYTNTGIQIVLPGFDANSNDYTIVIQKRNNG